MASGAASDAKRFSSSFPFARSHVRIVPLRNPCPDAVSRLQTNSTFGLGQSTPSAFHEYMKSVLASGFAFAIRTSQLGYFV